jgi:glycosyltransferase involved in cell wall biosynthesis
VRQVSGVLITFNEETKVESALESLAPVCDEIIVVDSLSTDQTPDICRRFADRFVQREWAGYRDQKQFAADLARSDWILSLDADERLSAELQESLRIWKKETSEGPAGFYLPRVSFFLGRWIRHTTWYPDWQLRLYRKSAGRWVGGHVHESVAVDGPTDRLSGHIEHFTYSSLSEYLKQLERFSELAALDYWEHGRRTGLGRLLLSPPLVFLKNFLIKAGFLDGMPGLMVSFLAATSTFFKLARLWELQLEGKERVPPIRKPGASRS